MIIFAAHFLIYLLIRHMKISHLLICALFGAFFTLVSCNSKKEEPVTTDQNTVSPDQGAAALSTEPPLSGSAASVGGEFHFKCPKGCAGGGAAAKGNCPVCGTELEHNQAFHAQVGSTPGSSPATPISVNPINGTAPGTTPATQPAEPPQNARGDWHFVCSKACGGGGGAQGVCPKCGAALAHNAEYHKQ
jgi:hypothetical protein